MEDWQVRVFEERKELREKIAKLNGMLQSPLYDKLDDVDQLLLCRQQRAMVMYQDILSGRIERFNREPTT